MENKLVYIAHPVGGDVSGNIKKILQICHDVHKKDNSLIPFVPYMAALQYLNDDLQEERALGIQANMEHFKRKTMDEVWLCGPRISEGMKQEIKLAKEFGIPIKFYNPELEAEFELL